MKQTITPKTTLLLATTALLLAACSNDDDERTLSEVVTKTENPAVYLYLQDASGHNLLEDNPTISTTAMHTAESPAFRIVPCTEPNDWGGHGPVLEVTPATPYHDVLDPDNVYTLVTSTIINIGDEQLELTRTFDYQLKRYTPKDGGRGVNVGFWPADTRILDTSLHGDTAHIIFNGNYALLRIEGKKLVMELRLPDVADSLLAQPLIQTSDNTWDNGLFQLNCPPQGWDLEQPYKMATLTPHLTDEEGSPYMALRISQRMPCLFYAGYIGIVKSYYLYYDLTSETLFGDSYIHRVDLHILDYWDGGLETDYIRKGSEYYDKPSFVSAQPYTLVMDWRE